jgi:hypothetical protein
MKTVELALEPITGYLFSIKRNTMSGWYEFEVGIPKAWVFGENGEIACEVLNESETGKLVKVSPKKDGIGIDDLIVFVEAIIDTNKKIAEKEREFNERMEAMKGVLEKEAKKYLDELDQLKVNSFKNLTDSFQKPSEKKEPRRKKPKATPDGTIKSYTGTTS